MRSDAIDITGQRFGRLVVSGLTDEKYFTNRLWLAQCDCGSMVQASSGGTAPQSSSIMRLSPARDPRAVVKHGHDRASGLRSPEYCAWLRMIQRCTNPNVERYSRYGGRGIAVCDEWRCDFSAFLRDMGPRPSPEHSIDRIDNDGHYMPSNCRWATRSEQGRNRSPFTPEHIANLSAAQKRRQARARLMREVEASGVR